MQAESKNERFTFGYLLIIFELSHDFRIQNFTTCMPDFKEYMTMKTEACLVLLTFIALLWFTVRVGTVFRKKFSLNSNWIK